MRRSTIRWRSACAAVAAAVPKLIESLGHAGICTNGQSAECVQLTPDGVGQPTAVSDVRSATRKKSATVAQAVWIGLRTAKAAHYDRSESEHRASCATRKRYNLCGTGQLRRASMALTNVPLGLAVRKTIEFVGVGPIGQKRLIDSFDYVSQGPLQRVNVVAPPSEDWVALFAAWGIPNLHVSLSIRSENNLVLLTLKEIIPLHFSIQASRCEQLETVARTALFREPAGRCLARSTGHRLHVGSIHASLSPERHTVGAPSVTAGHPGIGSPRRFPGGEC